MARINLMPVAVWLLVAGLISMSLALPTCNCSGAGAGAGAGAGEAPVLSGSAVSMGAGTYPRATLLNDGSIIGAYTAFQGSENIITLVSSKDSGASWQPLGEAYRGIGDIDNPYPLQLPSGRILVAYRNHLKNSTGGTYTLYRISVSYSDDNGATWQPLSTPASDPGPVTGDWEPLLRNTEDGKTLQIYYSRENSAADQDSLMRTSTDGGATWSAPKTISGQDITSRDGMVGVTSIQGTNLIAVFESEQDGIFNVDSITSQDDGMTWGNRQRVYTPTGTNNNAGAPQIINVGGTLVVSFMTDEDTQQHHWIDGASAKLVTSTDGGRTWGNKVLVGPVQSNWPGLLDLDENRFLMMFDHGGAMVQELSFSTSAGVEVDVNITDAKSVDISVSR
ncbi:MAG: hypothetical protein M1830_001082 [Pleopsidium flavum]|nr:MAG: hypothetical protein M1830_001082 [Pleopsidium flavum]